MKTKNLPFRYKTARRIMNWGYSFDSLTELKFAVSVLDEYEILRAPVSIYYHPGTRLPTERVQKFHRRYTPDFLIRHRETEEAFLIEIKPRFFEYHPKLISLKAVAENYIRNKRYDWKYKVVFDDEIILSAEQLETFEQCYRSKSKSTWKSSFEEYNDRCKRISPSLLPITSNERKVMFVLYGRAGLRNLSNWSSDQLISPGQKNQLSIKFNQDSNHLQ